MSARHANGDGTVYRRKDGRYEGAAWLRTTTGARKRLRVYGRSREEARQALAELLSKAHRGAPVAASAWRVRNYLDYWLPIAAQTRTGTTMLSYESICRNYLKPGLGAKSLTALSVSQLQQFLNAELERGCSIRTVQKMRTVLSAALSHAQREDLLLRNVARHVVLPTWRRKEIRPWTLEELTRFLAAAKTDPLYAVFVLLALYGLRCGEVLGLRWRDIDFEDGRIQIRQQLQRYHGNFHLVPTKTSAGQRDLPLVSAARDALLAHRAVAGQTDGLVFLTRFDNPIEAGNVRRSLRRISAQVGLPTITVHHLRHTTATLLKNQGVAARDAQLILGHATIVTTQQLYQHADLSGQFKALTQLERSLMAPPSGGRQRQPSRHTYLRANRNSIFGGSSQTRTGDTRLFSPVRYTVPTTHQEVFELAELRRRLCLLGGTAVICSRQVTEAAGRTTEDTGASGLRSKPMRSST